MFSDNTKNSSLLLAKTTPQWKDVSSPRLLGIRGLSADSESPKRNHPFCNVSVLSPQQPLWATQGSRWAQSLPDTPNPPRWHPPSTGGSKGHGQPTRHLLPSAHTARGHIHSQPGALPSPGCPCRATTHLKHQDGSAARLEYSSPIV